MKTHIGEVDESGISGLEEDELNLEAFIIEEEGEVKCSYEKTYLRVIAELSDLT
jgi:hypothetical protein